MNSRLLVFTQGDPAGIGPELILRLLRDEDRRYRPVVVAERAALESVRNTVPNAPWSRLVFLESRTTPFSRRELEAIEGIPVLDPGLGARSVTPGRSDRLEALGALAALDLGSSLARSDAVDALVTLPVNKASIAASIDPHFRGHTDYLASACGLKRYGADYLMAFLAPRLKVALVTVHEPLVQAVTTLTAEQVVEALQCLARHTQGEIALAGLNPHAGEGGLLGLEEEQILKPAVQQARSLGVPVHGPLSADSLFARALGGAFEWVMALYHDQGLIGVKTAAPGQATNWTLGLPYIRTSVDHGTAFDIAGCGVADPSSLRAVVNATLKLIDTRPP